MSKYSLIPSEYIIEETKIKVFELCKDDKSLLKSFIDEIENNDKLFNEFAGVMKVVEQTANLILRGKKKFRELNTNKIEVKLYEAKGKNIRLYMFHEEKTGRIIVTSGFKKNQKKDIKKVEGIIQDYFASKKSNQSNGKETKN